MRDSELYARILGVSAPWGVTTVDLREAEDTVEVFIEYLGGSLACPKCQAASPGYDHRRRSFRHLDTCQMKTILTVDIPRVKCSEHGVRQLDVPWAEAGSRFTAMFEAIAIDWLHEASISAVARRLRLSWDEVDGIQQRAVQRGLERREAHKLEHIGVDETSFQKRHQYVTVITEAGRVVHVADGRKKTALRSFYETLSDQELAGLKSVSMDMWPAYIEATLTHVPEASSKICFDRFHVAKHLNEAVNDVRKQEHRALRAENDKRLVSTRFLWLKNPENMSADQHERFEGLRGQALKVARAWAIKDLARSLWRKTSRGWARRRWKRWLSWAMRSRLEPIKKAARMIRDHLYGIENAIAMGQTNGPAEALNAGIQRIKRMACGFRNPERFKNAIYFHLGGLDLKPT